MSRRGIVTLVSGGLDSCVLVTTLLRQGATVVPLYVRSGLVWEAAEGLWLRRWLSWLRHARLNSLTVVDMPLRWLYHGHWSLTGRTIPSGVSASAAVYLPGRNVVLLSCAAILATRCGLSTLAIGTLAGNPFGDATPDFFKAFAACLRRALGHPIRVIAPFLRVPKRDIVTAAPPQLCALTFSCLKPRGTRHCGRCNKCAERQHAFRLAHVLDPTNYARP